MEDNKFTLEEFRKVFDELYHNRRDGDRNIKIYTYGPGAKKMLDDAIKAETLKVFGHLSPPRQKKIW